jgi:hypothetical protein
MKISIKMKYVTLTRILLTVVLLAVVYTHAHWSVGLALTFIAIAREFDSFMFGALVRAFGQLFESGTEIQRMAAVDRALEEILEKARARNTNQQKAN